MATMKHIASGRSGLEVCAIGLRCRWNEVYQCV